MDGNLLKTLHLPRNGEKGNFSEVLPTYMRTTNAVTSCSAHKLDNKNSVYTSIKKQKKRHLPLVAQHDHYIVLTIVFKMLQMILKP